MNKKTIYRVASLVMTLVMILGNTIHPQAATPVAQTTAPSIYWGALVDGKVPSSTNLQGVFNTFETRSRKKMSIIHWGQPWVMSNGTWGEFQTTYFQNVRNHGSIPMLNWTSWRLGAGVNQSSFQLRDIYAGNYDSYIRRWATAAKNWGHPFFLRFNHEMNGWWYPWGEGKLANGAIVNGNSAGDFARAWRHVHRIFEAVGATNVTWVWSPNHMSTSSQYPSLSTLYPGNDYVDWTGLSAYNKYSSWIALNPLLTGSSGITYLKNSYSALVTVAPSKPMMLGEWASVEAGDGGTKKAAWIRDALVTQIPSNFPRIKAVVWFNWDVDTGKTYPIESSWAATDAWARAIASTKYAANQYANLNTSPIPPLSALSIGSTAAETAESFIDTPDLTLIESMEVDDTPTESEQPEITFSDITPEHWAYSFIEQLYAAGMIEGCGAEPLQYCPDDAVTRAQLAVVLGRATHGATFVPAKVGDSASFDDVPPDHWAADFIRQSMTDGLMMGCKGGGYCPEAPVTRAEIAVFLLRFKYGAGYAPPEVGEGTGFGDVPPDHWAAAWIKQSVAEGIATGCGESSYCPDAPITRAELAVYLGRTFGSP